jgi:outer membrane protein assembly factor BamD (BamD/ComL family)
MSPLTCREVERLLDDFGRGDLPHDELQAVELHLAGCERCREAAELWSGFTFALSNAELDPLPPLVERRIAVAAADAHTRPTDESVKRTSRARWIAGIAAAAAVAAGISLWIALSPEDEGAGADEGEVAEQTSEPDQAAGEKQEQQEVAEAQPNTPGQGRQLIEVDDVTNLWIEEGSAVRVERLEERLARFRLDAGRVVAEVGPHPGGFRFIVVTPSGEVEAKGTIFAVEVRPGSGERARVMRGVVEVRTKAEEDGEEPVAFLVRAGESGRVGEREPAPLASDEMERDVCLLRGCAVAGEPVEVASNDPQVPATEACEPVSPEEETARDGDDPVKPTSKHPSAGGKSHKPAAGAASAASKGSGGAVDPQPSAVSPEDWEVETLVSLALSQRKAGMYPMAAETYRKLIREHGNTGAARNALVSLGQLELVELGRPKQALNLFERYLGQAPSGLLSEEARLGRVRAYARMGRNQDVVGAASDYLRLHLGGYAGAEVMRLRGDAKRSLGDCLGAIEDYRQVQSLWPTSPQNRKAEIGLTACRAEP